jgi:hypothetical protein
MACSPLGLAAVFKSSALINKTLKTTPHSLENLSSKSNIVLKLPPAFFVLPAAAANTLEDPALTIRKALYSYASIVSSSSAD